MAPRLFSGKHMANTVEETIEAARAWLDQLGDSIALWANPNLDVQPTKVSCPLICRSLLERECVVMGLISTSLSPIRALNPVRSYF